MAGQKKVGVLTTQSSPPRLEFASLTGHKLMTLVLIFQIHECDKNREDNAISYVMHIIHTRLLDNRTNSLTVWVCVTNTLIIKEL